jgi:gluconate 2-dehydrogenase gamma chain
METRRENLKILAAISATCAFPFSADELFGQEKVQPAAKFFTEDELKVVSRIADLIIPNTDTPGAVAAGVPYYIDAVVAGNGALQKEFRANLPKFGAEFLAKSEADQLAILKPLCEAADSGAAHADSQVELFRSIKNLTCDGYYTSQAGLVQELGYSGNMAMGGFPGCGHIGEKHGEEVHEH